MRPAPRAAAAGAATHDPATDNDFDWSLRKANVLAAWPLFGARPPGAGIRVGHPDTGYTPHPELADPGRLLIAEGYDFDDDDSDPLDDLNADFLDNPSHGTGTGSVILSGVGPASAGPVPSFPERRRMRLLIPIRTTETVVLISMRNLRRALDHATTQGSHVVSISLGGLFAGFGMSNSIARAVDGGTIVLAAAGNEVGFVVFPAAFEDVIAVAATNIRDVPWSGRATVKRWTSPRPANRCGGPSRSATRRASLSFRWSGDRDVVCRGHDRGCRRALGVVSRLGSARQKVWRRQRRACLQTAVAVDQPAPAGWDTTGTAPASWTLGVCCANHCLPPLRSVSCAMHAVLRSLQTRRVSKRWCI